MALEAKIKRTKTVQKIIVTLTTNIIKKLSWLKDAAHTIPWCLDRTICESVTAHTSRLYRHAVTRMQLYTMLIHAGTTLTLHNAQ